MALISAISSTLLTPDFPEKLEYYPLVANPATMVTGLQFPATDSRLYSIIEDRIAIYDSQLGYPSGLSVSAVVSFLSSAVSLFSIMRDYRKRMNVKQVVDNHQQPFGGPLSDYYDAAGQAKLSSYDFFNEAGTQIYRSSAPVYSNSVWQEMVGVAANLVIIPESWATILSYFFDNYFSLHSRKDDGSSQLFGFSPSRTTEINEQYDTLEERRVADITNLKTILSTYPTLRTFLSVYLNSFPIVGNFDFTRDLAQRTINIIDNPKLVDAIELSTIVQYNGISIEDHLEHREFFYSPGDIYFDPLNFKDFVEIDATADLEKLIVSSEIDDVEAFRRATVALLPIVVNCHLDQVYWSIPPGRLISAEMESGDLPLSETQIWARAISRLTFGMEKYPFDPPFTVRYRLDIDTDYQRAVLAASSAVYLKAGYNLFWIAEDNYMALKEDHLISLCLGELYDSNQFVPIKFFEVQEKLKDQPKQPKKFEKPGSKTKKTYRKNDKKNGKYKGK